MWIAHVKATYGTACLNLGYAGIRLEQHLRMFITNWIGSYDKTSVKQIDTFILLHFVVYLVAKVQICRVEFSVSLSSYLAAKV